MNTTSFASNVALIVIDVQNDFCPQGALAVPDGDAVIGPVNALISQAANVVLTQDWHPAGHASFASSHAGRDPFTAMSFPYGEQTLWPDHCVQGTDGAAFHAKLNTEGCQLILRKGFRPAIDSYSAFRENDKLTNTGLAGYLAARGIQTVVLCGLALDFCVADSAVDARESGFQCKVVTDACRAIDLDGSADAAIARMREAGVGMIDLPAALALLSRGET